MNTINAVNIANVPPSDVGDVIAFCQAAKDDGLLVCIRLGYDEEECYLYGCYAKTLAEVDDYYRNGGTWGYSSPIDYLPTATTGALK